MNVAKKWMMGLTGSALVVMLAVGATATFAQEPDAGATSTPQGQTERGPGLRPGRGGFGFRGMGGANRDEFLAAELGITTDALSAAREAARSAALAQAVADGTLTQEQADQIESGAARGPGRHHGKGAGGAEMHTFLAQELGISVDQLQAAEQAAETKALAQAVADGTLTQEQADLIAAKHALREYVDQKAIMAQALGMSVAELDAAHEAGQHLPEIIEARGLDEATVQAAVQQGYEAAVQQAVSDGVITQAQADQILSGPAGRGFGPGGKPGFRGPRGGARPEQAPAAPTADSSV
jgi:hypothetical protein